MSTNTEERLAYMREYQRKRRAAMPYERAEQRKRRATERKRFIASVREYWREFYALKRIPA
jgi:hypothetical protein